MKHFLVLPAILLAVVLSGCESSEERAKRLHLEILYEMDDTLIAENQAKAAIQHMGEKYTTEFDVIRDQCQKDASRKGRWCQKFDRITKIYPAIENRLIESIEKASAQKNDPQ